MPAHKYHTYTDAELLQDYYATRNNEVLGALLQRYTLLLLGVCIKYLKNEDEAKEAVQQIFLKVFEDLHQYPVEYFKSWLYVVARNYCLMKLRKENAHRSIGLDEELLNVAQPQVDEDEELLQSTTAALLQQNLAQLNEGQRQCLTLFYLEKKTYQFISDNTGYTLLQVKSYIQNGKRNLKNMLTEQLNRREPNER